MCGRVVGYQYASTDAVDTFIGGTSIHNDINSYYVDGVSITRGSPRQHVWALMAGLNEASYHNLLMRATPTKLSKWHHTPCFLNFFSQNLTTDNSCCHLPWTL